ncbi:hypothetical protein BJV82DRAFT_598024 [Fennellomyces sp. T-0311]|nr:hypothetical protein BJV82DRAFT_598024 [Fennellomyces sp. T-0311]
MITTCTVSVVQKSAALIEQQETRKRKTDCKKFLRVIRLQFFMTSQSPEVSFSSFTAMDEGTSAKNKMDLYSTPRAKRFSERVADAISPNGKNVDEAMDSPSPPGDDDDDDDDEYEPPPPKKIVRKRRSLIKYSDTAQRQRRKLRHNQKTIVESDDEYEEEEEVYRAKKQTSRQSSVGSDEGTPAAVPKAKNGRRRRLRLQNTSNMPTDTPDIDEDASPTFFPNKTRSINPSVAPIVVGTTSGVNKESRRRDRPDHITKKLDRLRHYPHTDMLDLSKHLIIPTHTSSTSTSSSPKRQDDNSSDGGESPIHIPDDAVMQHSETQESATPPPEPSTLESPEPVNAPEVGDNDTKMESFVDDSTPPSPMHYPTSDLVMEDTAMESPFRDMSIRSPIHDAIESPATPITPQPMIVTEDDEESSSHEGKEERKEEAPQQSYFGRVVGSVSRFFWGS